MAEKRDYYEVLGLQKGASADEIKGAYRKAALKWHPDRWVNGTDAEKKTAEEKFKEASEAYSVLSDPEKKARYDQFGFAGVSGAAGGAGGYADFDINDLLRLVKLQRDNGKKIYPFIDISQWIARSHPHLEPHARHQRAHHHHLRPDIPQVHAKQGRVAGTKPQELACAHGTAHHPRLFHRHPFRDTRGTRRLDFHAR